jgi:predicted DNA-binding transcriptional regulator YafY
MSKEGKNKARILYLARILMEQTDEEHGITMAELLQELAAYDIRAERKSIYDDFEQLRLFGIDVIGTKQQRGYTYHIGNRTFQLAELKLLVDSVQSAKFLTTKKSHELIKKIESFASVYEAAQLQRQVYVADRVKTANESIYYNVDTIHTAIGANSKITFHYFRWDIHKQMVLRKGGALYKVSPWALSWDDENYYLVAYDDEAGKIKHYRVDKMLHIEVTGEKREGAECFKGTDIANYAKKMFGMFGGEVQQVALCCDNALVGVMIDRFGTDIPVTPVDENHFMTRVDVAVSRQFLGWVFSLGEGVKIVGPEAVVSQMREEARRVGRQYGKV